MQFVLSQFVLCILLFLKIVFCQKVAIPLLARNKEHLLPYFFDCLDNFNYPKENLSIWIWSDHNVDNTTEIIKEWANNTHTLYNEVRLFLKEHPNKYENEDGPYHWPTARYNHVMDIKEKALLSALAKDMDYIYFLDMDNFVTNPNTLKYLIQTKLPLVAPMLTSGHYSNFWGAMDSEGYYKRDDSYLPIVKRENRGCHKVPMIHSSYLIDLRQVFPEGLPPQDPEEDDIDSQGMFDAQGLRRKPLRDEKNKPKKTPKLTFDANKMTYNLTTDDIIVFAKSAQLSKTDMHLCNNETFGYLLQPLKSSAKYHEIKQAFTELQMELLNDLGYGFNTSKYISPPRQAAKDKMGFDQIYLINLEKRPKRKDRMMKCLDTLGLDVKFVKGVDGHKLNSTYLQSNNISQLRTFKDPYHKRAMTMGEIGCFLSHYQIWREAMANDYEKILVLEDDIRFEPEFKSKVETLMKEPDRMNLGWDFIYLGRKRLVPPEREKYVKDSDVMVWPDYSYWTLSYALSRSGAQKLAHCSQLKDGSAEASRHSKRQQTDKKLTVDDLRAKQKVDADSRLTFDEGDNCPLNKMVPVDEYIPIMFDMHPEDDWKRYFPKRDLVAFSAYPLIVTPTHYTGDEGYISDTEDSPVVPADIISPAASESELRKLSADVGPQYSRFMKDGGDVHLEKNMREEL